LSTLIEPLRPKSISNPISNLDVTGTDVLIIEDEELMSALVQRYIQQFSEEHGRSFKTLKFESGWKLMTADLSGVKVAVVDILLPQVNGADLIRHFRTHYPNMGIIPITGMATSQLRRQIKEFLPQGFEILEKPLRKNLFFEAFTRAHYHGLTTPPSAPLVPVEKPEEGALWTSAIAPSVPTTEFKRKIPSKLKAA